MRQPLHRGEQFDVWFEIDESTDEAFLEIESDEDGPELGEGVEVVVAIAGEVCSVDFDGTDRARARLGGWEHLEDDDLELMIRVGEWFESWVLE